MKIVIISTLCLFLVGCNMNPNKEARIQQLETELERITEEINKLKNRVDTLEHINKQLNVKLLKIEH